MRPVVCAQPARLLRTMSSRSRGETPYTVAFRIETDDEVVVDESGEALLGPHLGLRVRGERAQRGILVEEVVGARCAVHGARRREDEPAHARILCRAGDAEGRVEVDVVGPLLVEIADGVVRECREMDDRVEPARSPTV